MYAIYCSNHENAGNIYENVIATNLQFSEWISQQKLQNPQVKGAGLESYLIKPVQRLCRYPLLLKELLKVQTHLTYAIITQFFVACTSCVTQETDPKHPDFAKISNALDKIQAVINKVNEFKRKFEGEVNVLKVQKRISGCPVRIPWLFPCKLHSLSFVTSLILALTFVCSLLWRQTDAC